MWAILKKIHYSGDGYKIAKFDQNLSIWVADPTQPLGADFDDLAVDPAGNPAFVAYQNKHIYHKKEGTWTKMEGCSYGIAFEKDGTLIR